MYRSLCIVLVLFAVSQSTCAAHIPEDTKHDDDAMATTCKEACNATEELVKTLRNLPLDPELDDPTAHCVVACWDKLSGIVKPDGTVNPEPMIHGLEDVILHLDEVVEDFKKCADQPGEGNKKAYKISVCLERVTDQVQFRLP